MRRIPAVGRWLTLLALTLLALGMSAGCGSSDGVDPPSASIGTDAEDAEATDSARGRRRGPASHPELVVHTSLGDVTVRLDREKAPITVDNFMSYVDSGHYDSTIFHQVVSGYIVLGGGYTAALKEKSAEYPIRNEAHNGLKNRRGTLAMARQPDVIDSSTSQFFINLSDNTSLDHHGDDPEDYGYCVFGEVIEGMNVVDKIAGVEVSNHRDFEMVPVKPVRILSVERTE